jgi:CYTH domain-containing protein
MAKEIERKFKVIKKLDTKFLYQGSNQRLITAEIEIPSPDFNIAFPCWVNKKQDITDNPRYFNINLGDNPQKL